MPEKKKAFAKLYGDDGNQVLVKIDHNDEMSAPEVRIFFQPDDLGVCACAIGWEDNSDASWDKAEACFEKMTEAKARELAQEQIDYIQKVGLNG